MEKKITKRMVLEHLIENYANDTMVVEYAKHEIELLDNKKVSATKTKTQVENDNIKNVIVETLTELAKPSTITEIQSANENLAELSNQKMSSLLKQLVDTQVITKTLDKKKAYAVNQPKTSPIIGQASTFKTLATFDLQVDAPRYVGDVPKAVITSYEDLRRGNVECAYFIYLFLNFESFLRALEASIVEL